MNKNVQYKEILLEVSNNTMNRKEYNEVLTNISGYRRNIVVSSRYDQEKIDIEKNDRSAKRTVI